MTSISRRGVLLGGAAMGIGLVAGCTSGSEDGAGPSPASPDQSANALIPLPPFAAPVFNDEGLFVLGGASSRSSEVGEVLTAFAEIKDSTGDPAEPDFAAYGGYVGAFRKLGERIGSLAGEAAAGGFAVTARNRALRSGSYHSQALFFVLGTDDRGKEEEYFDRVDQAWQLAVDGYGDLAERFTVTGAGQEIPCYFFKPDRSTAPRPTVIISEGSDGQNPESMQFGVTAGLARGYNVVLFEGPGQMSLLFRRKVPFTPDWDQVVGPVVAAIQDRPDVGRIGVIGISFAGMLCARAAARVPGLSACVLEPGAYNYADMWTDTESMKTVREVQGAPEADQQKARDELNQGFQQAWPSLPQSSQFTIWKRGEIFSPTLLDDARAGRAPTDYFGALQAMLPFDYTDDLKAITIPTLITANEGDEFFGQQSEQAFGLLTIPETDKALVKLTAEQGAQLHDQPMGPQVAEEIVFDWLDGYLA